MASKNDLVVKMTINSSDFDKGLKNAKTSMSKFNQSTVSASNAFKKAVTGMGKAFGALGLAVGGANMFKSFIASTQTIGDQWNNTMVAAKTSFQVFESAVMAGNGNILANFRQSISAAREFAEAMDAFGSAQISNQFARMQYVTPFNEAMTKYRSMKSSGNETGMAFAAADMKRYIEAYSDNAAILMSKSMEAVTAKLSSYTGGFINSGNVRKYLDQLYLELVNGVFPPAVQELKELRSEKNFTKAAQMAAAYTEKWGADVLKESDALLQLSEINDDTLKELLGILKTYDSVRNEINSMRRQMNRAINGESTKTGGGGTTFVASPTTRTMTPAEIGRYYFNAKTVPEYTDLGIPEEEIIEPETEALVARVSEQLRLVAENAQWATTAMSSFGSVFGAIGDLAGDNPFGSMAKGLGNIIGIAEQTTAAMMAMAGAENLAGLGQILADPFTPPLMKISLYATALSGILSAFAAIKGAFAGSFADGGVVGGNSYSGDRLFARVNSGEMILNRNQQAALFSGGGNVRFIIEGSQLKGVLDNYDKTVSL